MNYYAHHLGDYAAATAHLSWDEDMAYTRLIRAYYQHEKPIPREMRDACRLVRATSPAQRKAVETVLREFFTLDETGWHQKRCDVELGRYTDKRTKARDSASARWNAKRPDSEGNANASESGMRTHSEGNTDAERTQCEGNAPNPNPNPNPNNQEKRKEKESEGARATRLPDDWALTDARKNIAESEHLDPERTFLKFTDHWKAASGANARKRDWDAAWRNWCRTETDRNHRGGGNGGPPLTKFERMQSRLGETEVDENGQPIPW